MYALVRKDFIACRLFLLIGLAIYVLYALSAYPNPLGFFFVNIVATIIFFLIPIFIEEKYQIEKLLCYLPPPRRKVVLARYAVAVIALIVGLGLHFGLGSIFNLYFAKPGYLRICEPQAIFVFCLVPIVLVSLYLPCIYRLGLGHGSFIFLILLSVLAALLTGPILAMDIFSTAGGFVLTQEMAQQPELTFVRFIDHIASSFGNVRFYLVVSVGTVALASASIWLSVRFFEKRDC